MDAANSKNEGLKTEERMKLLEELIHPLGEGSNNVLLR
jgi:hypothetical protein